MCRTSLRWFAFSLAVAFFLSAQEARADFIYGDFSNTAGLNILKDAAVVGGNRLRLTPAVVAKNGAAIHTTRQSMQTGFETRFRFQITGVGGSLDASGVPGGDGLALVIQNQGASATGPDLLYIPYSVPNAFAIEFDTWRNANLLEPNGNNVSIQPVGAAPNQFTEYHHFSSLGFATAIPNLSDGAVHEALIRYSPGTLDIFIDNLLAPVLTAPIDLTNVNGVNRLGPDGKAWIGLVAGTGASYENHDVLSWSFNSVSTPVPEPGSLAVFGLCSIAAMGYAAARKRSSVVC